MLDLNTDYVQSEVTKMFVGLIRTGRDSLELSKLSARIKLRLDWNTQKEGTKLIDFLSLSEVDDPKHPNTVSFKTQDLGIITYELFESGRTDFELGKIKRFDYDENLGMYLTQPQQVLDVWNVVTAVVRHFESMKRNTNPAKTEFVSIRGTEYFGNMEEIVAVLSNTPIFDRIFSSLTTYHTHDKASQECRDNCKLYLG